MILLRVKTEDLDLEPLQVGNIQTGGSYLYVQRMPVRRYKQGLCRDNSKRGEMPWETRDWSLNSEATLACLVDNYPTISDAIERVSGHHCTSVAFSKRWGIGAVKGLPYLFYKDKAVGMVDDEDVVLYGKYFFLKENLLGVLNA